MNGPCGPLRTALRQQQSKRHQPAAGTWRFGITLAGYVYQLEKSGWFSFPTVSGGFLPTAWDVSSSGAPGLLLIEAPDPLLSGDVMAFSHFGRLVRSAFKRHVGVSDMLLTVPLNSMMSFVGKVVGFTGGSFDRQRRGQPGGTCKD